MELNIFEIASRKKLRFASDVGSLTVEQLWELPLTRANNVSLDGIYKAVSRDLKAEAEDSLVTPAANSKQELLKLQIDVIKHIASVKQAEAEAAKSRAGKAQEREQLVQALAEAQRGQLKALTPEEIQKRIAALDE